MAGYTRFDVSNNIANGNVVSATELDGEFDAIVAAFHATTGHKHDGTAAEGAPITVTGPAQDIVSSGTNLRPKTTSVYELGTTALRWSTGYLDNLVLTNALPIAQGGTGATTQGGAQTALGLVIGTNVQAWDADLDTYAANPLTSAELGQLQNIGTSVISALQWGYLGAMSAYGATLVDDIDAATARTTLGVVIGTNVQAYSANLDTFAANPLTSAELGQLQNIGTSVISALQWGYVGAISAYGATLIDDADAATARGTLGLGTIATQAASSVTITGGTINSTTVGATTPASGSFTTLLASDAITSHARGAIFAPSSAVKTSYDTIKGTFPPMLSLVTAVPAGMVTIDATTELVVMQDGNTAISIIAGSANISDLNFGRADNENVGAIRYFHSNDTLNIVNNATTAMVFNAASQINCAYNIGFGANPAAGVWVDAGSKTGSIRVPNGTTAQRPTGTAGQIRYNSTTGLIEGYTTEWKNLGSITTVTTQATTTGTAFDFTGIPSGVNEIHIVFDSVSTSGTDSLLVQIGDSGGVETTGYQSSSSHSSGDAASTAGFNVIRTLSSDFTNGIMILTRVTGNQWAASHGCTRNSSGSTASGGGIKTLSATLDRVRLTRTGTDTFDAGAVGISYR